MKSIISNSFGVTGLLVIRILTQALFLVLLTYILSINIYSGFIAITSLALILGSLSTMGAGYLMLNLRSKNKSNTIEVFCQFLPITILLGFAIFFVFMISSQYFTFSENISLKVIILIGICEILIIPLISLFGSVLYAKEYILMGQFIPYLPLVAKLLTVVLCLNINDFKGVDSFVELQVIVVFLSAFVAYFILKKKINFKFYWRIPAKTRLFNGAEYSLMHSTTLASSEVDKMLIINWLPSGEASLYSLANRIILASVMPIMGLLISAMPKLFFFANNPSRDWHKLLIYIFSIAILWGFGCAFLIYLFADLLTSLFNSDYQDIDKLLTFMAPLCFTVVLKGVVTAILASLGKPKVRFVLEVVGMIAFAISASFFSSIYQVKGIVVSMFVVDLFVCLIGLSYIIKNVKTGVVIT